MVNINVSNELNTRKTSGVIDLLRRPRLWIPTEKDYPRHTEWLEKTEAALQSDDKRAMVAHYDDRAIGAVVYRASENPGIVEIRNISIDSDYRSRLFGGFMLRQTEYVAVTDDFLGTEIIRVDTKVTNKEMIAFLISQGYSVTSIEDLYKDGTGADAILEKNVSRFAD